MKRSLFMLAVLTLFVGCTKPCEEYYEKWVTCVGKDKVGDRQEFLENCAKEADDPRSKRILDCRGASDCEAFQACTLEVTEALVDESLDAALEAHLDDIEAATKAGEFSREFDTCASRNEDSPKRVHDVCATFEVGQSARLLAVLEGLKASLASGERTSWSPEDAGQLAAICHRIKRNAELASTDSDNGALVCDEIRTLAEALAADPGSAPDPNPAKDDPDETRTEEPPTDP